MAFGAPPRPNLRQTSRSTKSSPAPVSAVWVLSCGLPGPSPPNLQKVTELVAGVSKEEEEKDAQAKEVN